MSGFSCMETAKRNNKPKLVLTMAPGVITVEGSELCFRNQKCSAPGRLLSLLVNSNLTHQCLCLLLLMCKKGLYSGAALYWITEELLQPVSYSNSWLALEANRKHWNVPATELKICSLCLWAGVEPFTFYYFTLSICHNVLFLLLIY